jgi:Zn-dependent protease with chaperone function
MTLAASLLPLLFLFRILTPLVLAVTIVVISVVAGSVVIIVLLNSDFLFSRKIKTRPLQDPELLSVTVDGARWLGVKPPHLRLAKAGPNLLSYGQSTSSVLIVPENFLELSPSSLRAIVLHELVHIRDHVNSLTEAKFRFFSSLASAVGFFCFGAIMLLQVLFGNEGLPFVMVGLIAILASLASVLLPFIKSAEFLDGLRREIYADTVLALSLGPDTVIKAFWEYVELALAGPGERSIGRLYARLVDRNLIIHPSSESWVKIIRQPILLRSFTREAIQERLAVLGLLKEFMSEGVAFKILKRPTIAVKSKWLLIAWLVWIRGWWSPFSEYLLKVPRESIERIWGHLATELGSVDLATCCQVGNCGRMEAATVLFTLLAGKAIDTLKKTSVFITSAGYNSVSQILE